MDQWKLFPEITLAAFLVAAAFTAGDCFATGAGFPAFFAFAIFALSLNQEFLLY